MNLTEPRDLLARLRHRLAVATRRAGRRRADGFGGASMRCDPSLVQRIYVINLDRKPQRWKRIQAELRRMTNTNGEPLLSITRRFSAVDARHLALPVGAELVDPEYTLGEQLFVQPNYKVDSDSATLARPITMSRQEIAVAMSHIRVWQRIVESDVDYTLILEDDGYFTRRFSRELAAVWKAADDRFDLLYLSHKYVGEPLDQALPKSPVFTPRSGVWQLSGYVLTRAGATQLLSALPVRGPVDLWMNHKFEDLRVLATRRSIIRQRGADSSSNDYSVLPVLAQVGALSHEKPHLPLRRRHRGPVFVAGSEGTEAVGMALAMLGYRCVSNLDELPVSERDRVAAGDPGIFDAYVNVAEVAPAFWSTLAARYPRARFVWTGDHISYSLGPARLLQLPGGTRDPWQDLTEFLELPYPPHDWPIAASDKPQQQAPDRAHRQRVLQGMRRRWDRSPWIINDQEWNGLGLAQPLARSVTTTSVTWRHRDDTFPGNLAVFDPDNVIDADTSVTLALREERGPARDYTAAAIASTQQFKFGVFAADIRAVAVPGVVTGFFLHRNGPRQEIDVEIAGHRPTKMLVNVFFNPGNPGDKLEYGYRGTPVEIDLGFDASSAFHRYEIEWWSEVLRWRVDGRIVHERHEWDPTPIPQHAMELNVNLWPTRSRELAGRLDPSLLPAQAHVRSITVCQQATIARSDMA